MPDIVKYDYVVELTEELCKPEYVDLSDVEVVEMLNAPGIVGGGLFKVQEVAPSIAEKIGVGKVFLCNMPQLRAYIASDDEDEIKADLAGRLFSSVIVRAYHEKPDTTTDEIMETEVYKERAALVERYTGVGSADAHKAVLDKGLSHLRDRSV